MNPSRNSQQLKQDVVEDDELSCDGEESCDEMERKVAVLNAATEAKWEKYRELLKFNFELSNIHEESAYLEEKIRKKYGLFSDQLGNQFSVINFTGDFLAAELKDLEGKKKQLDATAEDVESAMKALKVAKKTQKSVDNNVGRLEEVKDRLRAKLKKVTDRNSALKNELEKRQNYTEEDLEEISEKIHAKTKNIADMKKQMKALKVELANVNSQIKEKEELNAALDAADRAKMDTLLRKVKHQREERSTLLNIALTEEMKVIKELREKNAQLDRKITQKQIESDEMKKHLEEENKQVRKAIDERKLDITIMEEEISKARQRKEALQDVLKDDALSKVQEKIQNVTASIAQLQEHRINMETSFLERQLQEPSRYSDSSGHNNIIAWMRDIQSPPSNNVTNNEEDNEDPTIDCEVSSTYQAEDNFDFK
ncbi:uncharacterized protein LOC129788861 [Lutzomyia longipalpis]|uniref:uncharacterized protein LOC129788861 n=1 Tax=Lutzomyia longipalpis TaxID=7200 RepID=UPI002483AFEF|nr:uncharacterized protein LOC129788861 [Lutzomyia longipalpis]XP_055681233.1 uncharacterized protein LOC129788861 [Lutzomyia longipalpis]